MAYLPILTYHRLLPDHAPASDDPHRIAVSVTRFRQHVHWLKRMGYQGIGLNDYGRRLRQGQPVPRGAVAITFDDGYEEILTLALPILQEVHFSATVFCVSGQFGGRNAWDQGQAKLLSGEQIRALRKAGVAIGAHTANHAHLPRLPLETAKEEIVQSKKGLEELLGEPIPTFAYPYGESTPAIEALVQDAGFEAAFATSQAPRDHAENLYRIRRVVIFPKTHAGQLLVKTQRWYPAYQDWRRSDLPAGRQVRRFAELWFPVLLWCGVIFWLSSIPSLRITTGLPDFLLRKMAHLVEYAVLALLTQRALKSGTTFPPEKSLWIALAFSVLYACSDEYHQTFVVGREGAIGDILIDSLGAGLALVALVKRRIMVGQKF